MEVQRTRQLKTNHKKITVVNITNRDCRILAIELNLLGFRFRVGMLISDACDLPDDNRNVENIAVNPPCRDCDIYEGMYW